MPRQLRGGKKDIKILQKSRLPHPPGRIQTTMRARGCGRLALPLLLLSAAALAEGDAKGLKEGETPGNFMEDEQWLSSISQYSGKIKHWNRFRDVSLQGQGSARGLGRELRSRDPGARSGGWLRETGRSAGKSKALQCQVALPSWCCCRSPHRCRAHCHSSGFSGSTWCGGDISVSPLATR